MPTLDVARMPVENDEQLRREFLKLVAQDGRHAMTARPTSPDVAVGGRTGSRLLASKP